MDGSGMKCAPKELGMATRLMPSAAGCGSANRVCTSLSKLSIRLRLVLGLPAARTAHAMVSDTAAAKSAAFMVPPVGLTLGNAAGLPILSEVGHGLVLAHVF